MKSVHVIDQANLEATATTVDKVLEKLDLTFDFVIGHPLENGASLTYSSIEDFSLFMARKLNAMKNSRVIFFTEKDSIELIGVILRQLYKELTGHAEFPVSEALEVYQKLGKDDDLEDLDETDASFVRKAKRMYKETMKNGNFVDGWMLAKMIRSNKTLYVEALTDKSFLIVFGGKMQGASKDLFEAFFSGAKAMTKIQVGLSLDGSLNGNADIDILMEPWSLSDLDLESSELQAQAENSSNTEAFCQVMIISAIKLLVNTREELSLARIISDAKAFGAIKNEGAKSAMPLYQTVVSYVQKVKLGGKSYAPKSDHPFAPFTKDLTDFVDLMNKLHSKLEDEQNGERALIRIIACLKSFFFKTLKQSSVENVIEKLLKEFKFSEERWNRFKDGNLDNLSSIKLMMDRVSTSCKSSTNAHVLLGKLNPDLSVGTTPIAMPNVLKMYQTPIADVNEITSSSPFTSQANETCKLTPKSSRHLGKPRFAAAMAWAVETSPLLLNSADRNVRTSGPTLCVGAEGVEESPKTSEKFRKGLQEADAALVEARKGIRPSKSNKTSKRTILGDLKNVEKWEKMTEKLESKTTKKAKLDIQGAENELDPPQTKAKPTKRAGPSKKKQPAPLLKGQTKMTAFFRL